MEARPGQELVNGHLYMRGAKGELLPLETVKASDRLRDDMVRQLVDGAEAMSSAISAFKKRAFDDVDAFLEMLAAQFATKIRGEKGNLTLQTVDGCMKVQVQVADQIRFGPELQVAKELVDQCIAEWSADSGAEIRAIVMNAFRVDKEGQVNRAALLGLRRLEITDDRWLNAMRAIEASIQVEGTKRYIRVYRRPNAQAAWIGVPLDIAAASLGIHAESEAR